MAAEILHKNFWYVFEHYCFLLKKVPQLQKYWFWAKFDKFLTIFHELSSDSHIILGNRQFISEMFLVCL